MDGSRLSSLNGQSTERSKWIFENLLVASLKAHGLSKIPFIWFWPEGFNSCVIMTHDVETKTGRDFCSKVIKMNRSERNQKFVPDYPRGAVHGRSVLF